MNDINTTSRARVTTDWATVPPCDNGRTHGLCVRRNGELIVFAQDHDAILHYAADGTFKARYGGDDWLAAHGLTYQLDRGKEVLWLTDNESGRVAKTSVFGQTLLDIPPPNYTAPDSDAKGLGGYAPTWALQSQRDRTIWLADGYGQFVVHRMTDDGKRIQTLTGEEGAGRFNCPHGLAQDDQGRVYIADRGNHRIAIYDADGTFIQAHDDLCHSPCGFDLKHGLIVIPELLGSIKLFDQDWRLIHEIGRHDRIQAHIDEQGELQQKVPDGWPNVPHESIPTGSFNSPHAACFGNNGEAYVAEWILGGRVSRIDFE